MIISLINHSEIIANEQAQQVVRVINRQLQDDFEPYWSFGATLRLEGPIGKQPSTTLSDMRGDAVLYLVDGSNAFGAMGWYLANYKDIPYGFVFLGLSEQMKEAWSITLSHEALELVGDPLANLLVEGNHPMDRRRRNDFLARAKAGKTLESFGMNPGGHLNIFDPRTGHWEQPAGPSDAVAALRKKLKNRLKAGRGYRRSHPGCC